MLSSDDSAPPLTQSAILARFDAPSRAGPVRLGMRSHALGRRRHHRDRNHHSPRRCPSFTLNKGVHRLLSWGKATTNARAAATNARADIKAEAREGKFLNDIPPPTIAFSGGKAIIGRVGMQGTIYFEKGNFADPRFLQTNPFFNPLDDGVEDPDVAPGDFVTARIYSYDLDGELAWSASTTAQAP